MKLGTRGSALALAQARPVAAALGAELVAVRTSGDRGAMQGDKGRWVRELERALLDGAVDVAVHSAKDVPTDLADGTELIAALPRADPRDVLLGSLPPGARVGTSSLRRSAQLRAGRADVDVRALRGNVDTRLRKLEEGEWDAIVLAAAGLERLGIGSGRGEPLDWVPAAGQGVVVLQARAGEEPGAELDDPATRAALTCERTLVAALGATCHTPLGAHCADGHLRAWLGLPDGSAWLADEARGDDPEELGVRIAARMRSAGADDLLAEAERIGDVPPASLPEGVPLT